MFPDDGHEWPLWEDGNDKYAMEPSDYNLSSSLTAELRAWYDYWFGNFSSPSGELAWRPGTGRDWSRDGRRIAQVLAREVEDFADVRYDGRAY